MKKAIDISNERFNDILVLSRAGVDTTNKATWNCLCDCGNTFVAVGANLKNGNTKSCGCRRNRASYEDRRGNRYGRLTVLSLYKKS